MPVRWPRLDLLHRAPVRAVAPSMNVPLGVLRPPAFDGSLLQRSPPWPVENAVLLPARVPARVRCVGASAPGGPPPLSWRTTSSNRRSNRPSAPPPPTGLEKRSAAVPSSSSSSSSSSASTWLRCSRGTCSRVVAELSARLIDASSCRARMAPKLSGGSAIASRLSAAARDAAGESARAATSESMSDRSDGGNRSSIAASARWPSTARYRLANAGRRVSLRTTSGSRLPAARSDACTASASSWSRVLMLASTKTTLPSVHAGSPGSPGATCRARPESAEASKLSRPGPSLVPSSPFKECHAVMPSRVADAETSSKIDIGTLKGSDRRHVGEMSGDVVGGRVAAGLREPTLAEADEDPREATRAGRVVVMGELAGRLARKTTIGTTKLWLDGASGSPTPRELLRVGHRAR